MNNNQIIYVFYNGTIAYGTYDYSMGKINKVTYPDISYYSEENDKLIVELVP